MLPRRDLPPLFLAAAGLWFPPAWCVAVPVAWGAARRTPEGAPPIARVALALSVAGLAWVGILVGIAAIGW